MEVRIVGALSPTHWLILAGVLLLLFGAKRLPETARGIGRSARILKSEMREVAEPVAPDTTGAPHHLASAGPVQSTDAVARPGSPGV
jgi:sec-independent protein translocase protein TatA